MKGRTEKCYGTIKTNNIGKHNSGTDPSETLDEHHKKTGI